MIHKITKHNNVMSCKGYFYNNEGDLCVAFEKMDKSLKERINEEKNS